MHEYRGIPIRWRQDHDGRRHDPRRGRGLHGIVSVGTVSTHRYAGEDAGWSWSMTATGEGANYALHRGIAGTKEAAIEACNRCYVDLMEVGENYEAAVGHNLRLAKSTEHYERRGDARFRALDQEERDAVLTEFIAQTMHPLERRLMGIPDGSRARIRLGERIRAVPESGDATDPDPRSP